MAASKRIKYVDQIKGLLIVFMVLFHIDYSGRPLFFDVFINSFFNLGVFFCVSGFFIKEESLVNIFNFLKSKALRLYLPALYICIPLTVLHNFFFDIGWYSNSVDYAGKFIKQWSSIEYLFEFIKALFMASREPICGAMWFAYCLIIAFVIYALLSYVIIKIVPFTMYERVRFLTFLFLQFTSCFFSQFIGFTIPRFSTAISVLLLIHVGNLLFVKYRELMFNKFILLSSILIVLYCTSLAGTIVFNANNYRDALYLDAVCICSTIICCNLFAAIENLKFLRVLETLGSRSFYIMGLHMVGFKLCTCFFVALGIKSPLDLPLLKPLASNAVELVLYLMCGLVFPVLIVKVVEFTRIGSLLRRVN